MRKYAILIGIDQYHESLGNLKYAGTDCRRLKEVLLSGKLGFDEDRMLLLDDTQEDERKPTFANIHTWLSSWLAQPKKDDMVLFYYAGHGRDMDSKSYLVPCDATLSTLHTLGIPLVNIQELMGRCKARNKILIIDACHSGAGRDVAPMSVNWQDNLSQSKGIYTITSCGVDELSHEWDEKSQGVFSWFLSEALSGHCPPNPDGKLTIERIYEWIYDKVTNWATKHRCKQTPQRFYQGSGSITLTESEPDYKAMVEQTQKQLAVTQKEFLKLQAAQMQAGKVKTTRLLLEQEVEAFVAANSKLHGIVLHRKLRKYLLNKLPNENLTEDTVSSILKSVQARQVNKQSILTDKYDKRNKIDELTNQLEASQNIVMLTRLLLLLFLISIVFTAFSIFVVSVGVSLLWIIGIVLGGICILCLAFLFSFFGRHYIPVLIKHMYVKKQLRVLKYGNSIITFFIRLFKLAFIFCCISAVIYGGFYISKYLVHHYSNLAIQKLESSAQTKINDIMIIWDQFRLSPHYSRKELAAEIASISESVKAIQLRKELEPKTRSGWRKYHISCDKLLGRINNIEIQANRHQKGIWVIITGRRSHSLSQQLWSWDENNLKEVMLCKDLYNSDSFVLSPDKKRVAYDDGDIYVVNIDGSLRNKISNRSYIKGWENKDTLVLTNGKKYKLNEHNAAVSQ